jgi:inorganic pyrophosphatase
MNAIDQLEPLHGDKDHICVVIDTPRGSRNKFKWDEKLRGLKLSHVLTAGAVFPFDFGYLPGTRGADGDALDVLLLTDEPLFPGCIVPARLVGVIEAEQTQKGKTLRNDRLLAVATPSHLYAGVRELDDLPPSLADEIEQFFINYNVMRDRVFKPVARRGSDSAWKLMKQNAAKSTKRQRSKSAARR